MYIVYVNGHVDKSFETCDEAMTYATHVASVLHFVPVSVKYEEC